MHMALGFVIGIAVGGVFGLLFAPAVHAWLGRLEWRTANREIELTDRLLESLEPVHDRSTDRRNDESSERPSVHAHAH